MKRILLLQIASILFIANAIAQPVFYKDSFYTAPFQRLVNAIPVNLGADSIWDDPELIFPIGFQFKLFQDSSSTLYGLSEIAYSIKDINSASTFPIMVGGTLDLINKDANLYVSPISYTTEGTAPNRIFKLEFRNAGLYDGLPTDSIDEQVWLYEGSNILEFHYGNVHILSNPSDIYLATNGQGDFIGIIDSLDINNQIPTAGKSYFFSGSTAAPQFDSVATFNVLGQLPGMDSTVMSNTVYRIAPKLPVVTFPNAVYNIGLNANISFHYVQETANAFIENYTNKNLQVKLVDANGRLLQSLNYGSGKHSIALSNYASGIYYLQIRDNANGMEVFKIAK